MLTMSVPITHTDAFRNQLRPKMRAEIKEETSFSVH